MNVTNHSSAADPVSAAKPTENGTLVSRLRARLTLPVLVAGLSLAVIIVTLLDVIRVAHDERAKVIARTIRDNSNLAIAFEEYTTRTFAIADAITRLVEREVNAGGAVQFDWLGGQRTLDSRLVADATVLNEHGAVIAKSNRSDHRSAASAPASAELAFHAVANTGEIHIGVPESVSPSESMLIPISRRLNKPDGSYAGIVFLEVQSTEFTKFYDDVSRRPDDVMALVGLDGVLRARQAGRKHSSGLSLKDAPIWAQQAAARHGSFSTISQFDGIQRFVSYRTLEKYPFLVTVGVSERDALADVVRLTQTYYWRAGLLILFVGAFAFLLVRALHRREKAVASLTKSEATLRAREEEFRVITESLPQLVWITDADGRHTYFNRQWIDYTGLTLAESVGDGWQAAFDPSERERAVTRWQRAVARGEIYEAEYRLRGKDGNYRWMLGRALPLRDSSGRITKWFGTSTDVHTQIVAQAQLREAQQIAHIGSWSRDSTADVDSWSEELYNICGVSPAQFTPTADSISELVHPDDRPQYRRDRARPIRNMTSMKRDMRIVRPDGEVRSLHHNMAVERDATGVPMRVHGTVQDVTESRAAEQRLREQAGLLNLTRDAIIVRDSDDTVRFWNQGAERIYGWTAEEIVGRNVLDLCYVDRPKFLRAKLVLDQRGEWSGELDHYCKDGTTITMSSRWSAVTDEQTSTRSVLMINAEVTEQKKLEQQLLRHQRLESIGTLASGVAHDLNNILAPILMAAPLLRQDLPAEKRNQLVALFEKCAERGASIVRQVLTFARGANGERVLLQPLYALNDLAEIITETFPKSITVERSYPEDLPLIEADPTQLHQVLLNLCVNARDAMPDGGTLTLSAKSFEVDDHYAAMTPGATAGPHLLIEVHDTGTGIRPDIMEKIFDPFFTTKPVGDGTGLGLSTVLGIVKDHGGTVNAESNARGTTFRILLPALAVPLELSAVAAESTLPQGHGETILIVDDEEAIRLVAEPLLQKYGYNVLVAADGPAALAIFAAHSAEIAVTLTDLSMPIMSGVALARTIRKMRPDACIIISAGREDDCLPADMEEIGIAATLPKPYTQAALLRLLAQVIAQSRTPL